MINKIFLDMDGVICDFRGQCEKLNCIDGYKVNWDVIHNAGTEFWETIEWIDEGKNLYDFIINICKEENIELYILTTVNYEDGKIGKKNWIKNNTEIDKHHIIITNKGYEKAFYADISSVLIDDFKKNCNAFAEYGGQVIHHISTAKTKEELLNLIWKHFHEKNQQHLAVD